MTTYKSMFLHCAETKDRDLVLTFSSEEPVLTAKGWEVLDHSPGAVDLGRLKKNATLLVNHDPEKQTGPSFLKV